MRQTLFYIPATIGGMPLFGIGLAFWGILIFTAMAIAFNRIRKGTSADCWNWLTTGLAAAAVVAFVLPVVSEAKGLPVRGYGVFLMLGIAASAWLLVWRGRRLWNVSSDSLLTAAAVSVLFGVLGARIFYICEYWSEVYDPSLWTTLINMINVTRGGLVVYGSIIGGIIALILYLFWKKMPVLATLDLFAPALMLGLAFGRLGCLMNGCCFGGPCDHWPGITFPPGSPAHVRQLELGQTAIGGIWLEPELRDQKTLFKLKESRDQGTTGTGPVRIRGFEHDCDANKLQIKSGTILLGAASCPRGTSPGELVASQAAKIPVYRINCNEDFILFMVNRPVDQRVLLVLRDEEKHPDVKPTENIVAENNATEKMPMENIAAAAVATTARETAAEQIRYCVITPLSDTVRPVHPTQIYSSFMALVLCLVLMLLSRFYRKDGLVIASLFILYPVNRFLLELVRTDEGSFMGTGLTVSQCISLVGFVVGVSTFILISLYGSTERAYTRQKNKEDEHDLSQRNATEST